MMVTYKASGDTFAAVTPQVWSDIPLMEPGLHQSYDIAPIGNRLAVVLYADRSAEWKRVPKVAFLLNFLDELRRRVPIERK
jgi:hypothetical protein